MHRTTIDGLEATPALRGRSPSLALPALAVVSLLVACAASACGVRGAPGGSPAPDVAPAPSAVPPNLELQVRTDACGDDAVVERFEVTNHGAQPVRLADLEIRFWLHDTSGHAVAPSIVRPGRLDDTSANLRGARIVAEALPTTCSEDRNGAASWEVRVSPDDDAVLAPGATWRDVEAHVALADGALFAPGPASWYSRCVAGPDYAPATHHALYAGGRLVRSSTGVPPVCRAPHATQRLSGHVAGRQHEVPVVGPVPQDAELSVGVAFPIARPDALEAFLRDLYDPASPSYGHYLTPAQFGDAFGPTQADYDAVAAYAVAHGLAIDRTFATRTLLSVRGPVSAVQDAFSVTLNRYRRADGTTYRAPANEPELALEVPVVHLSGLENATRPVPLDHVGGTGPFYCSTSATGSPEYESYVGADFRNVYFPCNAQSSSPLDGTGQTIALVDFGAVYPADFTTYVNPAYGGFPGMNPNQSFSVVHVGTSPPLPPLSGSCGAAGYNTTPTVSGSPLPLPTTCLSSQPVGLSDPSEAEPLHDVGVEGEPAVDVEMVAAMAPGASIVMYQQESTEWNAELLLSTIAENPDVSVISCSWGWSNYAGFDPAMPPIFQQFAALGKSFLVALGDLGAFVPGNPLPNVIEPAIDSALITAVGGTHLATSGTQAAGTLAYASETTWNDDSWRTGSTCANQTTCTANNDVVPGCNSVSAGGFVNGYTVTHTDGSIATWPALARPIYQQNLPAEYGTTPAINSQLSLASTRMVPDVSLAADGMTVTKSLEVLNEAGTQATVYDPYYKACSGGTSAASPLWAGVLAMMNEQRARQGQPAVGFANPLLYAIARASGTSYAGSFHDVADGSNNAYPGNVCSSGVKEYNAYVGFDLTTGLGTPACGLLQGGCVVCAGSTMCADLDGDASNCGACGHACAGTCAGGVCQPVVLASITGVSDGVASDGASVYWTDQGSPSPAGVDGRAVVFLGGRVRSVSLATSAKTTLASKLPELLGLARSGGTLLFATDAIPPNRETSYEPVTIESLTDGGGTPQSLLSTQPSAAPVDMVVEGTYLYWVDGLGVWRVKTTGGTPKSLWTSSAQVTLSIGADSTNVYWTTSNGTTTGGTLWMWPIATSGPAVSLSTNNKLPFDAGHALTSDGTRVYYLDGDPSAQAGGVASVLIAAPHTWVKLLETADGYPHAIMHDANAVYWVTRNASTPGGASAVQSVPKTGGPVTTLAVAPTGNTIAVDSTNVYWTVSGDPDAQPPTTGSVYAVPKIL